MEINDFINSITQYYGEHKNKYVMVETVKFIKSRYSKKLEELKTALLRYHPHQWGFPDISAVESSYQKHIDDVFRQARNTSYPEFKTDLSISEEEWKNGFKGLEALKNIVNIDEYKPKHDNGTPSCLNCRYKPIQTEEGFDVNDKCKNCGERHINHEFD